MQLSVDTNIEQHSKPTIDKLIDLQVISGLLQQFNKLIHAGVAIVDLEGNVVVQAGWQEVCTDFFRQNEKTRLNCLDSDIELSKKIAKGDWKIYKCKNGLWDVATPIYIDDEHVANFFIGQFIFNDDPIDYDEYEKMAKELGFDVERFFAAFDKVPRWERGYIDRVMAFGVTMKDIITQMSYSNIQLNASLRDRESLLQTLMDNEKTLRSYLESAPYGIFSLDNNCSILRANKSTSEITGFDNEELKRTNFIDLFPEAEHGRIAEYLAGITDCTPSYVEIPFQRKDGTLRHLSLNTVRLDESTRLCFSMDIQNRIEAENESQHHRDLFSSLFNSMVEGVSFHELIFDSDGKPIDYRIVDVNPSYERILKKRREEVIGQRASTLYNIAKAPYLDVYANVVRTGKPAVFETNFTPLGKHFQISVVSFDQDGFITIFTDITRSKRNVEELRESELKFRAVFENIAQGVVIQDINGNILSANPAAERILDFKLDELKKMQNFTQIWDIIHEDGRPMPPEDNPPFVALRTGEPVTNIAFGIRQHPEEEYKWLSVNSIPQFRPGENVPFQVITTFDDFSYRKNAELEMYKKNEYLAAVFDSVNDAIFVVDAENFRLLDVNAKTCEMYGYSRQAFINNEIVDLSAEITEASMKYLREKFILARNGNPQLFEWRAKTNEGKAFWTEINVRYTEIGFDKRYFITARDISIRKKTEEALVESEKYSRELFKNSPISIQVYDKNGLLLDANHAWEKLWKLKREDLIGKYNVLKDKQIISEANAKHFRKAFSGEIVFLDDMIYDPLISGYEGRKRWLNVVLFPIKSLDESFRVVLMQQDITAIKDYETELIAAKEKAEESDRLKSAFLANMSHEIRTPLNGIIGFTDLLSSSGLSEEDKKDFVDVIKQSSYRLMRIVNDLIDVSKIETGQMEINLDSFNINFLLNDLYDFHSPLIAANGIGMEVITSFDDKDAMIYSDEQKLHQILMNLISNAIKYTKNGKITIGYTASDGYIRFFVTDTGKGIATDSQGIIFDGFRQEDQSLSRQFEGVGLGLTISKGYVEILGGTIGVESKVNEGSTFFFTIPMVRNADSKKEENKPEPRTPTDKSTILIAEDEDVSFNYISKVISLNTRFKTIRAINGREAIDLAISSEDICLILMDIRMPILDGYSAARQIKAFSPDIPIVALTAFALEGDGEKSLEAGCDYYIPKPVEAVTVLKTIRDILGE